MSYHARFERADIGLTIRSSGSLRRVAVLSFGTRRRPLNDGFDARAQFTVGATPHVAIQRQGDRHQPARASHFEAGPGHHGMNAYLSNRWSRIGLALVVLGWGPLLLIVLLAALGLWPDPNPNPIGPGLLFFITFWPAVACLAIGAIQTRRK